MIITIVEIIDAIISKTGNVLDRVLNATWQKAYDYQEWKCEQFGHKPFTDYTFDTPFVGCKRGCGPIEERKKQS